LYHVVQVLEGEVGKTLRDGETLVAEFFGNPFD
jgi:hypothetical protein